MKLTLEEALDATMRKLCSGRLGRARQLYERVLRRYPDNDDALHHLGVIAYPQP